MLSHLQQTFQIDFMRQALFAGLLVGALCGYIGLYVVLKRIAFVGVALAEMSSAGVALALWTATVLGIEADEHSPLTLVGAVGLMLVGVLIFSLRRSQKRVPEESHIGIGYAVAAALGLLLIAKSAHGESHMMDLMFGDILTVTAAQVRQFAAVAALVAITHLLFAKEFLFVSFDPEMAGAVGYRTRRWELLLNLTLGITIAFAIRVVGVLLVFALLVMPAVTALLVTRRLHHAMPAAILFGVLPIAIGLDVSYHSDLPSAACIVVVSFVLMVAAGGIRLLRRA